ncbi:hypothetical protein NE560_11570, partial [Megasphaera massiliensis]|nr:hypothetical protein [Megasphaera massiliensis]
LQDCQARQKLNLAPSLLKRMEKLELIRKETRHDDQRGVSFFLTKKGCEKAKRIREVIYGLDDFMW